MLVAVGRVGQYHAHRTSTSLTATRCVAINHAITWGRCVATRATDAVIPAPSAAYIHLPFCKRKCFYCDFPVETVGLNVEKTRTQDRMQAYVELVCSEIKATQATTHQQLLETVSFGGGTPSLVPPHLINRILQTLQQQYGISSSAEISLEADPGTFNLQRLQQYKDLGVTRLSMGVQCFQEELLQTCGRSHTLADVYAAIDAVKAADIPSWSLDLISGLPKLTLDKWKYSLDQAISANPDHMSVYDLQIEEGTPFDRWYSGGSSGPLPREPEAVQMFELASQMLTDAGYEHYEISNYAKPGHRSRHNQIYWNCKPYYAFGLGAASYVQGRRVTRPRSMRAYENWVHACIQGDSVGVHIANQAAESQEERLLDQIMLSLRLSDGLSLHRIQAEFGPGVIASLLPAIQRFLSEGLMQLTVETYQTGGAAAGVDISTMSVNNSNGSNSSMSNGNSSSRSGYRDVANTARHLTPEDAFALLQQRLLQNQPCGVRLTDPAGFLLSNDVISDLFAELEPSALLAATR